MKTNKAGIDLIKKFEGLYLNAYICPAKKVTIGYGHTRTAQLGMTITECQAEELLQSDLEPAEAAINYLNTKLARKLNENEFSALVSFVFNLGVGNFNKSTLKSKLLEDINRAEVALEFRKWVYAAGVKLDGLVKRRAAEARLFLEHTT